jgi:hypothetical protein
VDEAQRVRLLAPPAKDRPVRMVLDTDAYNEIDDQFALAYALLCPERLSVEAIYAAPFHNSRSDGPGDGMRRSHAEVLRLLDRLGREPAGLVFEGSARWLSGSECPVPSPAADDLVARATSGAGPLYVVAIGAPTNVASALAAAPAIAGNLVVVWLGGQPHTWPTAHEFNLRQDPAATRMLLDSGVPLVHVPCRNVTEHLRTTGPEIERYVRPAGRLGAYLADIFARYVRDEPGRSKPLWDLGPVAWLVDPDQAPSHLCPSPILTGELTWSHDPGRHLIRQVTATDRDAIFADLFRRLAARAAREQIDHGVPARHAERHSHRAP